MSLSYLKWTLALGSWAILCFAINAGQSTTSNGTYDWHLPKGFPEPIVPADNPMTDAKVELGRHLFYDVRMSVNGKSSCATCHRQELAFTDGLAVSKGTTGQFHSRNAMSLVNIAYSGVLTWNDPGQAKLEEQALVPMFGTKPVELGLTKGDRFIPAIRADITYKQLFPNAFPGSNDPFTIDNVCKAIACFERSIISARSPYDRYHYGGDFSAVSDATKRGEVLFFSEGLHCFRCHGGFNFSDATISKRTPDRSIEFHNTGLYNLAGPISYPMPNVGIYEHTKLPTDIGRFKTPTLRNVEVTGPYMHDGSIATLEEVVDHYAAGGRTISSGPYAGDGSTNRNKDARITGFTITPAGRSDLVAFLKCLTDQELLHDQKFANPWNKQ